MYAQGASTRVSLLILNLEGGTVLTSQLATLASCNNRLTVHNATTGIVD